MCVACVSAETRPVNWSSSGVWFFCGFFLVCVGATIPVVVRRYPRSGLRGRVSKEEEDSCASKTAPPPRCADPAPVNAAPSIVRHSKVEALNFEVRNNEKRNRSSEAAR